MVVRLRSWNEKEQLERALTCLRRQHQDCGRVLLELLQNNIFIGWWWCNKHTQGMLGQKGNSKSLLPSLKGTVAPCWSTKPGLLHHGLGLAAKCTCKRGVKAWHPLPPDPLSVWTDPVHHIFRKRGRQGRSRGRGRRGWEFFTTGLFFGSFISGTYTKICNGNWGFGSCWKNF